MTTSHQLPYAQQFTQIKGNITLHRFEWDGNDEKPPVVYIPGFIGTAASGLKLGAAIAPQRRVLALDLRGRGESDKPESQYGIETHLTDIQNLLAALDIPKIIIAGHSYGATIALSFAAHHPQMIEKVILLDGGIPPSEIALQMTHAYYGNLTYEYPSIDAYIQSYQNLPTLQPWTPEAEQMVRANLIELPDGTAVRSVPRYVVEAELKQIEEINVQSMAQIYQKISMPVLLVRAGLGSFGAEDRHLPDEVLATLREQLPQLQVYDMPKVGHTGILTVPDDGRDAVLREFIQG